MLGKIKKDKKGFSLVELIVVVTIIGILAAIGVPQYNRFIAKSRVRRAATELLQNIRLARTMAIKENRNYLIVFNEGSTINYRIGVDMDGNGSLLDAGDEYGTGSVREIDFTSEYGDKVVLGSGNFTTLPVNGPNGVGISNAALLQFTPGGLVSPNGASYIQHTSDGYTTCVEVVNSTGKIDLYVWQGHSSDPTNTVWTELR